MPLLRSLILAVVPRSVAEAFERESRLWMLICPKCGGEKSFWDIGGIRYKAVGNPRKLIRCSQCGWTWHRVEKRSPDELAKT
jgi:hypothetical protein